MRVVWSGAEPTWLATIDFGRPSLGNRDDTLQIRRIELPALAWTLFVVLAPMHHGLSCLDVYGPFDSTLREIFFAVDRDHRLDHVRRKSFERVLRTLGVERRSDVALRCFGLYPTLWGDRYFPKRPTVHWVGRLLSIAVPSGFGDETQRHLEGQVATFGSRCVSPAREDEILFWHGDNLRRENVELLVENPPRLGADGRARVGARLRELVQSLPAREIFLASLDGALRRGGLVDVPNKLGLVPGDEEACHELWKLRMELCAKLQFAPALNYVRTLAGDDDVGHRYRSEANGLLAPYPVVDENPLASLAP